MESANYREDQNDAVADGRRIYLGNLLYVVQPSEIEQALEGKGFGDYTQIHISVDPVSGRNPGYCFVDFNDRATAERALTSLNGVRVGGRDLRVRPGQPQQQRHDDRGGGGDRWGARDSDNNGGDSGNRGDRQGKTPFQRWGDWKRSDAEGGGGDGVGPGPRAALDHFNNGGGYGQRQDSQPDGKRLYIGGLGQAADQDQNQEEMTELLAGFNPIAIGKRITARDRETMQSKPGNSNYCFVDFETADEAAQVMAALDGAAYSGGGNIRVSLAKGNPERSTRQRGEAGGAAGYASRDRGGSSWKRAPAAEDGGGAGAAAPQQQRALGSNNWRRKE